ncbi:MAG: DUF438 domain-containing protein [Thermoplasmatales archaeon]|nr:DUF438 domain-containing protein [Thermoplasmatales archaeon]
MEAFGDKKGILKSIIKQIHEGADIEEVRDKLKEVMKDLKASEIAEVEQELINEGIPREEIHKLCDIHLSLFKERIEKEISLPDWHPVKILMKEHEKIEEAIKNGDIELLKKSEKHYLREENILFPYLEKHGIVEPPAIMWREHDKIREMEKEIFMGKKEKIKELGEAVKSHFYKEDKILFPTAIDVLSNEEWKEIREQFDEIGYFAFEPEKMAIEIKKEFKEGVINFETGEMRANEIEAMLNTIPFDITFVDKDDTVKYFNQSKDRIFVRTKAIIGRKVQNCHPSKSVHIVNKIIDEFKKGKRNEASFWIDVNGRKILIRYFAVRKNGEYVGTIEVTQDITDIKKIEGEKRLLDWE